MNKVLSFLAGAFLICLGVYILEFSGLGIIPLFLGFLVFMYVFAPKEQTTASKPTNPPISPEVRLNYMREVFVAFYVNSAEDLAKDFDLMDVFHEREHLIEESCRIAVLNQEKTSGSFFLTQAPDNTPEVNDVLSMLGKQCFARSLYFLLRLDEELKEYTFSQVIPEVMEISKIIFEEIDDDFPLDVEGLIETIRIAVNEKYGNDEPDMFDDEDDDEEDDELYVFDDEEDDEEFVEEAEYIV